jgi:IS30 family transposase
MAASGQDRIGRRLAAILAADVAGYSRLTGVDEEGTHAQLQAHLRALVDPKVAEHRGRVIKIAGWLKRAHPEDERYHVSHETIYRSLFVQARGVLKKELLCHLRSKRTIRRNRPVSSAMDGGKSRISSRSVSDRQRLKIGRCLAIGRAISCPGRRTAISRPWSSVIPVT